MQIKPERAQLFAKLYEVEFGESITEGEAEVMMIECLELMKMMMADLPGEGTAPQESTPAPEL